MWKDYLAFSKSERVAFWALSIVLLLSVSMVFAVKSVNWGENPDNQAYQDMIYAYFDSINLENNSEGLYRNKESFDINNCSAVQLKMAGLSVNQIKNLISYRSKGGVFKSVSDLQKIYSIDSITFNQVCSSFYVKNGVFDTSPVVVHKRLEKPSFTIELNSSDTISLSLLPGIGAALARRIVKYREKIGGFYCTDQLLEVYGIDPDIIKKISSNITVDTTLVEPKNLNQLTLFQMKAHPYLDFYKTRDIVEFRNRSGAFISLDQIFELESFSNCDKQLIKRYFNVLPI